MANEYLPTFEDYLVSLKEPIQKSCLKIEFLNEDDTTAYEIVNEDVLSGTGSLNVQKGEGVNRTFSLLLSNLSDSFDIHFGNIWLGSRVRLSLGLYIKDQPYYIEQGVFLVKKPTSIFNPNTKTITLECVDKWGALDGTLGGSLTGIYYIPVTIEQRDIIKSNSWNTNNAINMTLSSTIDGGFYRNPNSFYNYNSAICTRYLQYNGELKYKFLGKSPDDSWADNIMFGFSTESNSDSTVTSSNRLNIGVQISSSSATASSYLYYKTKKTQSMINANRILNVDDEIRIVLKNGTATIYVNDDVIAIENYIDTFVSSSLYTQVGFYVVAMLNGRGTGDFRPAVLTNDTSVYYQYDMFDMIQSILKFPKYSNVKLIANMPTISESGDITQQINTYLSDVLDIDIKYIVKNEAVQVQDTGKLYYATENNGNLVWGLYQRQYYAVDNLQPLLSSSLKYSIKNGKLITSPKIYMPYSLKKNSSETYASILLEIGQMLPALMRYNAQGRLVVTPTEEDIDDSRKEVIYDFKQDEQLYEISVEYDFENVANDLTLIANIAEIGEHTVRGINIDPRSDTNVYKIGNKTKYIDNIPTYSIENLKHYILQNYDTVALFQGLTTEEEKISKLNQTAFDLINESMVNLMKYYMKRMTNVSKKITISGQPIYHIDVDKLITYQDEQGNVEKYLIDSFTLPIFNEGRMTLNGTLAQEYDYELEVEVNQRLISEEEV